ncbi:hypothetical protein L7F22_002528 [Adiantum nelumboides]|nr:hypothetical protein [Adiantum nelumboides]
MISSDPDLMLQLQRIWSTDSLQSSTPEDFSASCITESSLACRATATSHRRDCHQRERALRAPVRSTQRILQDCPGDPYFSGRHIQITAEIRRLQELRSEFSHHASVSYWISKADRMNRDFFVAHRERPAGSTMRAIRDTHGVLHTDPDQVLEISSAFYEELFTADPVTVEILDAREQIWFFTHSKVTEDMCYHLMAPFTVEELHDAVHMLAPSSCPGDDGLTRGFFVTHWELMHVWLLRGCQDIFTSGFSEGELWRRMCLKKFPEVGNKFKCLIDGGFLEESARGDNQHQSELKSSTYCLLLQRLSSPPLQRTCIAEPLHASSTDNLPQESVAQTLYPESEYPEEAHSYWSSVGEANASVPETLTYRLVSDLCVVHDVKIKPFLASFQFGNPIYSSQMVRFRFGYARSPKPRWSGLFQCINQRPNKATTDDYVWTYESPAFPMAQESTLQTFRLPNPTLCIGGILQVELMGRVQTQATDRLYYICVSHVYVSGQPILDFKLDSIDSAGQVMLRQVSEKHKPILSKRTHFSMASAIEKNDGASIIEHLKANRSELRSDSIVDRLLLYLLDAKLLNDLEDE